MRQRSDLLSNPPELISSTKMKRAKECNPEEILENEANAIDVKFVEKGGGDR
jgi:hypothetical protein